MMMHFVMRCLALASLLFVISAPVVSQANYSTTQRASIDYSLAEATVTISHLDSKSELPAAELIDIDCGLSALLESALIPHTLFYQQPFFKNSVVELSHSGPSPPRIA